MAKTIFGQKCIVYNKESEKILVLERSNYKQHQNLGEDGFYDLIGGSVEYGEDSKESIIREGEEECGIVIKSPKIIDLHSRMIQDGNAFFIFGLYFCEDYEFIKDEIKLSHEHKAYKWVTADEFRELKLRVTIEHVKDVIVSYLEGIK